MNDETCGWNRGIDFIAPKPKWRWYVFGVAIVDGARFAPTQVDMYGDVPLWHRILTRIVLRSKWERLS